ncbi:MAG: hypothetical protein Q4P36_01365, partial [Bowdeniella nasicola]|nr:hypothetical protein [Bowdeniella nasicola]
MPLTTGESSDGRLSLTKTADRTELPPGGGKVTYTYEVTNLGAADLYFVSKVDDKCGNLEQQSGDDPLEPNASATWTCSTVITETTTNTATMVFADAGNNESTVTAQETVTVDEGSSVTCDQLWWVGATAQGGPWSPNEGHGWIGTLSQDGESLSPEYPIDDNGSENGAGSTAAAIDPTDPDWIYYAPRQSPDGNQTLGVYRRNAITGEKEKIVGVASTTDTNAARTNRIAFDPDGNLWSFATNGHIYKLDMSQTPRAWEDKGVLKNTSAAGPQPEDLGSGDIAFDGLGTMYLIASTTYGASGGEKAHLFSVSKDQLAAGDGAQVEGNYVGVMGEVVFNGLAFIPNGQLFASSYSNNDEKSRLYLVDINTGKATPVKEDIPQTYGRISDFGSCALPKPELRVEKTADLEYVTGDVEMVFTIKIENIGTLQATGVTLKDALPDSVEYVSSKLNGEEIPGADDPWVNPRPVNGKTATLEGVIPAGDQAIIEMTVKVKPQLTDDKVCNQAEVNVTGLDVVLTDNPDQPGGTDPTCIPVAKPGINVDKSVDKPIIKDGDTVTYTYKVTNTGNEPLSDVTLSDDKCPDPQLDEADNDALTGDLNEDQILDLRETWLYSCTQALTIAEHGDLVVNTADVLGTGTKSGNQAEHTDQATVNFDKRPELTLVKSADKSVVVAGELVTYSFVATNSGNTTLENVTIVDDPARFSGTAGGLSELSCTPGQPAVLAPGEKLTCSATYTVTQADVDSGGVSNEAKANGDGPDGPVPEATDDETVNANQAAGLSLTKSVATDDAGGQRIRDVNGNGITDLGDTVVYDFAVENTGNVTVEDLAISDAMLAKSGVVITCPVTELAPGESTVCTSGEYTIIAEDVVEGNVHNVAKAEGSAGSGEGSTVESNEDSADVPVVERAPGLTLVKGSEISTDGGAPGVADVGDVITYTYTVTNSGNIPISNITMTDTMSNGAKLTFEPSVFEGPLAPGEQVVFTATYTVTQADVDSAEGDLIKNTAVATGETPDDPDDSDVPSNEDDEEVRVPAADPKLTLVKSVATDEGGTALIEDANGNGITDIGDTVTYKFTVTNDGNVTISKLAINDAMLAKAGVEIDCAEKLLAPGESTVCTSGTYTINADDVVDGKVHNVATATGSDPDGNEQTSNESDEDIPVKDRAPELSLVKGSEITTDGGAPNVADVGDVITYTYTVTNSGNIPISNITMTDTMSNGAKLTFEPSVFEGPLAPGKQVVFTATYTVTQADVDSGAGQIKNEAVATGETPDDPDDPDVPSPPDEETVPVPTPEPALHLVKAVHEVKDVNANGFNDAGDTVIYRFTVTNNGNVTINDVAVTDQMLAKAGVEIDCAQTLLAPNAQTTCTATPYTITQADVDKETIHNVAFATGKTPPMTPHWEPPEVPTSVDPEPSVPGLKLVKSGALNDADGDEYADAGETITYTFTVTNTGDVDLTPVTLTDEKLGLDAVTCVDTLAAGASADCAETVTYTLTDEDVKQGYVANTATAVGDDQDPDTDNPSDADQAITPTPPEGPGTTPPQPVKSNEDEADVPTDMPRPGLALVKTAQDEDGDGIATAGERIFYSFVVTNTGNVEMSNIAINDPMLTEAGVDVTCDPTVLAPAESVTCHGEYTVTQEDVDSGTVHNAATATGTTPDDTPVPSDEDETDTPTPTNGSLTLEKKAELAKDTNGNGKADEADEISFSFVVTNTG